jgi:cytoskeletal protein CcmA (bactofilin family)
MASISTARTDPPFRDGSARTTGKEAALSVIAAGTRIAGELTSDGVVKVEGVVVGTVRADRQVLVAKGGVIEGDVYTRDAVVGGEIHGAILADDRVEVQSTSIIQGDITTLRIVVHEGGEVNGHVRMGNPQALEQAKAAAAERLAQGKHGATPTLVSTSHPSPE